MLSKIRALKEKKGFTLVELIVVLVILAILAALLVPALTGYIDKAKEKNVIAETRQVVMAAQTLVDEAYGKKAVSEAVTIGKGDASTKYDVDYADVAKLAEIDEGNITLITVTDAKIATVKYTKAGKTCTYTAGAADPYSFT